MWGMWGAPVPLTAYLTVILPVVGRGVVLLLDCDTCAVGGGRWGCGVGGAES